MQEAFLGAPEANELRYGLANFYASEGEFDRAIELLKVIAGNPHYGSGTREYIAELEKRRDGRSDNEAEGEPELTVVRVEPEDDE